MDAFKHNNVIQRPKQGLPCEQQERLSTSILITTKTPQRLSLLFAAHACVFQNSCYSRFSSGSRKVNQCVHLHTNGTRVYLLLCSSVCGFCEQCARVDSVLALCA